MTPVGKLLARKLDLEVQPGPGRSLLVTGPNGSGKTSVFRWGLPATLCVYCLRMACLHTSATSHKTVCVMPSSPPALIDVPLIFTCFHACNSPHIEQDAGRLVAVARWFGALPGQCSG